MRDTFVGRLLQLAESDSRIMLLTGDLGFGVLDRFAAKLPSQFVNVGVAEQNLTGVATGLALSGRVAFTYSIGNFPTLRCLEQIRNDAAYHHANVKVVAIGGGFSYGALGMSHHAMEDLAILRAIPGISVYSPGCLWEVEALVDALVAQPGTCYLRLDKSSAGRTGRDGEEFVPGAMRQLTDGADATIIATGGILGEALAAEQALRTEGIAARVLSCHSLRPFDVDSLRRAVSETAALVTVEEHVVDGGLGGLVAETCLELDAVPGAFARIGLRNGFASVVGSQAYLRAHYGMDAAAIVEAVRGAVRRAAAR